MRDNSFEFPASLAKYSESPTFDQDTLPQALRRDHNTKAGVWGRIVVLEGALIYQRAGCEPDIVTAAAPATVFPKERHFVRPKGAVRFKVEFYLDAVPTEGACV